MQFESQHYTWFIIGIVIVFAVILSRKVIAKFGGFSITTDKTDKDKVVVEEIEKSDIEIKNRTGQDVSVKKVSESSHVKIG